MSLEGYHSRIPRGLMTKPPKKRLVICCDGTWQSSNHGLHTVPSNVAKISRSVSPWGLNEDGTPCPQIVYYDSGVGTTEGFVDKAFGGGFGAGLSENVCEAYNFVVSNYTPGDELYFFGFSRGAYTARATAALICNIGICRDDMMERWWEAWEAYKARGDQVIQKTDWATRGFDRQCDECPNPESCKAGLHKYQCEPCLKQDRACTFEKGDGMCDLCRDSNQVRCYVVKSDTACSTCQQKNQDCSYNHSKGLRWLQNCYRDVEIACIGCFDTVGALGLNWLTAGYFNYGENIQFENGFHDTDIHPSIKNAFHALALDERRKPFTPTLMRLKPENKTTNLIQCWFPGVHINIGGGNDDGLKVDNQGGPESMANTTFAWMLDRVRESTDLHFDPVSIELVLKKYVRTLYEAIRRDAKKQNSADGVHGWGTSPITESFTGAYKLVGPVVRTPGGYYRNSSQSNPSPDRAEQQHIRTNEYIHPVVGYAIDNNPQYRPKALDGFERTAIVSDDGKRIGSKWVKKRGDPSRWHLLISKSNTSDTELEEFQLTPSLMPFQKPSIERALMIHADDWKTLLNSSNNAELVQLMKKRTATGLVSITEDQKMKDVELPKVFLARLDKELGFNEDQSDQGRRPSQPKDTIFSESIDVEVRKRGTM